MSVPAALLLVILCSGYCFNAVFLPAKYFSAREAGHRLYFRAVFYGAFLTVCTSLMFLTAVWNAPFSPESPAWPTGEPSFSNLVAGYLEFIKGPPGVMIALSTFPFALVLAVGLNGIIHLWPEAQTMLLREVVGSRDFEKLVLRGLEVEKPLLVTLDTGKVYAGWVVEAPNPMEVREHLRIMPTMSGYRVPDTHEVEFTVDYLSVIEEMEKEDSIDFISLKPDFEIVLPSSRITSAHIFDSKIYSRLSKQGAPGNLLEQSDASPSES